MGRKKEEGERDWDYLGDGERRVWCGAVDGEEGWRREGKWRLGEGGKGR